jgi:alkanesulfonate monooxygenase SsuD/methylene tetrahydromethanopterin reductase-like flavin-dependent oxidoreductase (luciferase family)
VTTTAPLAPHSISLRLYPHLDLPAPAIVDELRAQAALGAEHGFDGVMTSEHHGGFAGYLPNPLQVAGWCLEAMATGWAAPCPLLLPLRPAALVAEEVAWLAARFPGRVGLGVAAGALPVDFEVMGVPMDGLTPRFVEAFELVAGLLQGDAEGAIATALAGDPALAACAEAPVPMLSAAMGRTAVARAARLDAGILLDSLSATERCAELIAGYHDAGGQQSCCLIRRAWVGELPGEDFARQVDVYRSYSAGAAQEHWQEGEVAGASSAADAGSVVAELVAAVRATGADALNLRVHVPGVGPQQAREQIARLGDEVLPALRIELGW